MFNFFHTQHTHHLHRSLFTRTARIPHRANAKLPSRWEGMLSWFTVEKPSMANRKSPSMTSLWVSRSREWFWSEELELTSMRVHKLINFFRSNEFWTISIIFLSVWFCAIAKGKSSPVAKWVKVGVAAGSSSPNLAAHSAVVLQSKEILLFGGFQTKTAIDHCYQLELL